MIRQYVFLVSQDDKQPIPNFWAYRLYAWMLEQVPPSYGEQLHIEGETPISQYLYFNRDLQQNLWTVSLLNDQMIEIFGPVLDQLHTIQLHGLCLSVVLQHVREETISNLVGCEKGISNNRRTRLYFAAPTAFKSDGRYGIFPQERWLLQSMVKKWNQVCPNMPLEDADALILLEKGLHIVDYSLRTVRYSLKGIKIPAFVGNIVMESRLSAPLQEIWQLLVALAPYSGIGIKTTLGMGGVFSESTQSEKIT